MKPWTMLFLMLTGCTEMMATPTLDQLDWNPPHLSVQNCPDLSGRYLVPASADYRDVFPVGSERELFGSRDVYLRDKNLEIYVTLSNGVTAIIVEADNGRNHVQSTTKYDGITVGCYEHMMISRFVGRVNSPGESWRCTSLLYGEKRIYLNAQKDLVVEFERRERCGAFGRLADMQPKQNIIASPVVFRRAK